MKVYKLVHKDYKGELIFGLPFPYNQFEGEKKINKLLSKYKPWNDCIPYYKNSKFAFISLDAFMSFLLFNTDINEQELNDIENNFYIESFEISSRSSGLSKFLCTYFDDEINIEIPIEKINIKDLRGYTFKYIIKDLVPNEDIKFIKEKYYQNIKTYYN